jgi:hypothetical protein
MQNLIIFCQHCFTWVEPHSETCPDCGVEVDLDRPDPDRETLAEVLGAPVTVLGPVRVERQGLPNYGVLIGTTTGVLFVPRLHRRINGAWEGVTSQRLPGWWPFQGDLASPRFLNWLRRPFAVRAGDEAKPEAVDEAEIVSLSDRLMDSPGAFFVDRRLIRSVTARRRTIKLDRSPLRTVTLIDESDEGTVLTSLNALAVQNAWQGVQTTL